MSKRFISSVSRAKKFGFIGLLYILISIFCIKLPTDPNNPSNSNIKIVLESSSGLISEQLIIDTVGKDVKISAINILPSFINNTTVQILTLDGLLEWDTSLVPLSKKNIDTTLIIKQFKSAGDRKVIATVLIENNSFKSDTAFINVINKTVTGKEPSTPAHLRISNGNGDSIRLIWDVNPNTSFYTFYRSTTQSSNYTVFRDSITDTKLAISSDKKQWFFYITATNTFGKSMPSDTISTKDTGNIAPSWDVSDTLTVKLTTGTQYSLKLSDTCFDSNGDILAYILLDGNPLRDTIKDFVYSYTAISEDTGTYVVKIVAKDPNNASDTLIIKIDVGLSAVSDAVLSLVELSAGTLLLQNAPVPDTIRDTVSYIDSSIHIIPVSKDTLSTIMVNGKKVLSGAQSDTILLTEGDNSYKIIVTSQGAVSKTYTLIVTRKPNSTITLTSPPAGVTATSTSALSIKIFWNSLFGANTYTVQRSNSATGTFTTIVTTGSTSIFDTGLVAGTHYFYRVNASNSTNNSEYSTVVDATTLIKLSITNQSHDTTAQVGSTITFKVEVTGSDPQFEWSKDNVALSPQPDSDVLTLTTVTTGNAGIYSVKIRNVSDSVICTPIRLRVLPKTPAVPVVTVRSATSCAVSWATVDGALWYRVLRSFNSANFASACSTSQISVVDSPLVAGGNYSYRIIAGNNDGISDTGSAETATTWSPPSITTPPQSVTIATGQTITLSVVATGNPACAYLWMKDGTPMDGKTESVLTIPQATTAHGGIYTVIVSNSAGSIEKSTTVTVLPTYTLTITQPIPAGCIVTKQKDTVVYVAGSQVTLTATAGANYRFDGWSGDTTVAAAINPLTITMGKNLTVIAIFKKQFTVSYSGNNNSSGSPPASTVHDTNTTVTVASNTGPLQRDGYDFSGWNTMSNGSGINYIAGSGTFIINTNVTLYAKWVPITCQVNFNTYGGTNVPVQTVNQGSLVAEPVSTRSGITLIGWYREASYQNRWNFATQQVTSSITLHAKWLVMDKDENVYDTVRIGNQTWMVQNLRTTKYSDGSPITIIEDSVTWANRTSAAFCWPYNISSQGAIYGAIYNGYAAKSSNIAPSGWRVPSIADFQVLYNYVLDHGSNSSLDALRSGPKWLSDVGATNTSGFTAFPVPNRNQNGAFEDYGDAKWWTSTDIFYLANDGWIPYGSLAWGDGNGCSIRCIKNE